MPVCPTELSLTPIFSLPIATLSALQPFRRGVEASLQAKLRYEIPFGRTVLVGLSPSALTP